MTTIGERSCKAHLARKRAIEGGPAAACAASRIFHRLPPSPAPGRCRTAGRTIGDRRGAQRSSRSASRSTRLLAQLTLQPGARETDKSCWSARTSGVTMRSTRRLALSFAPGRRADSGFFVITSRCSFEMVAKGRDLRRRRARFGVGADVACSRACARRIGVRVIAVARADKALSFVSRGGRASGGMAA